MTTQLVDEPSTPAPGTGRGGAKPWRPRPSVSVLTPLILFVAVLLVGGLTTPGFLTLANAKSVMTSSAYVGIIAVGMTLVMLCGRLFSMALGTTAAVGAFAFLYGLHLGVVAAVVLAVSIAVATGWIQGRIIAVLNANSIIVTISASALLGGFALFVTGGRSVQPPDGATTFAVLNSRPWGIPMNVIIFVCLVVLIEWVLRRTRFGAEIYAVGENRAAAKAAAISIPTVTAGAFAIASGCAGLAGGLLASFNQTATLSIEGTYNFDAIAAALVGGNLVTGGRGSAVRTFFGAIVIATLGSLLLIRGYSTGTQLLVKGVIVFAVVCIIHLGSRKDQR